ncbi:MAG: hypothetical protein RIN56_10985 [Sporomusaceae bacterium]|nr:hypothetical protein [Sporomusaceae bacterium]
MTPLAAVHGRSCGVLTTSPTARNALRKVAVRLRPRKVAHDSV